MKLLLTILSLSLYMSCLSQNMVDSLEIKEIYVPNSVTFDSDNVNDGWRAESNVEWDNYMVQIYNSWGECIWASDDIKEWWYGQKKSTGTHYSRDGIYIYYIMANKGFYYADKKGFIYVIR